MIPAPVKPLSNTQRAIHDLRQLIFTGDLPPGSDHLESELAARLGMSRTPIREAALTLETQGLLEMRPRKGVRILPVSVDDMREIYDVLTELESLAARRAAERQPTDAELQPLARAIDDMEVALERENRQDWAKADDRFHRELMALGGNTRAQSIAAMMADQVRRARNVTLFLRPLPVRSNEDHRAVLTAIRAGQPDTASAVHRAHRQAAGQMIVTLLDQHRLSRI